jgi:alpha/beta superfamily hydrolase
MDDGVLDVLARALETHGIASLRFNFRGVGGSEGQHDGAGGEIEDLRSVLAWIQEAHPEADVLLGGYSFGASTVCRLLAGGGFPDVERILLVAPPVGNLPVPQPDGSKTTDVFVGDADPFVDHSQLAEWTSARLHILPGADHFFGGQWQALEASIGAVLD